MADVSCTTGDATRPTFPRRPTSLGVDSGPALGRLARLVLAALEGQAVLIWLVEGDDLLRHGVLPGGMPWDSTRQDHVDRELCRHFFESGIPAIVAGARDDVRTAVVRAGDDACMGIPLIDGQGRCLGAVCVIDEPTRAWDGPDLAILEDLAASAMTEIDLRAEVGRLSRSEGALRESERRYRLQAENSTDMIARYDPKGLFLDASPACRRLLGYEPEELIGMPIYSLIHPDDLPIIGRATESLLASPGLNINTCRLRHKDGHYVWVEGASRLVLDPATGAVLEVQSASRDVTERIRAEEALRISEERFHLATLATNDAIWDWDLRTDYIWWNESVTRLFGHSLEGVGNTAAGWYGLLHPDDRERVAASVHAAIGSGMEFWAIEYRFLRKDGTYAPIVDRGIIKYDEAGRPTRLLGSMMDLTRIERAEAALRESRERLVAALLASGTGTYRWDVRSGALECDEQLDHLFGLPPGRTVATLDEFLDLIHPDDRGSLIGRCRLCVEAGVDFALEFRVVWPDNSIHWLDDRGKIVLDDEGLPLYMTGACVDVTRRKLAEEVLAHQASHDSLTELPNRAQLRNQLERCISVSDGERSPFSLLLLDLDRFKEINDTFGHHCGDEVLRQLGQRLLGDVRGDGLVARLGGDEFGVILPGADERLARMVADRIRAGLETPIVVDGQPFEVGVSIGIALYPQHGLDASTLMKHADIAMYSAKRARTGCEVYATGTDDHSPRRLRLVGELRNAIDDGQLRLYYQPTFDLKQMRPVGVEALVRWQHPSYGLIGPGEFIPMAEQTGLIRPLGLWALREALRQHRRWCDEGLDLGVSVNLSPENLQDDKLTATIEQLLLEGEVLPRRLTVEVTEGAMMADPARAKAVLTRLHRVGVLISIDDFGTGYSSLAYLKELPADEVKVDRSFVRDMASNERDACIVQSVIELGHNLDLRVVAEGVEDRSTLDLLASWGCDLAQGYFLGRPMPACDIPSCLVRPACGPSSSLLDPGLTSAPGGLISGFTAPV